MTYHSAWLLAEDQDFMNRVGMCAESEGKGFDWGIENRRRAAASPGFSDAYASALVAGIANPGRAQEVISDKMILSAVQALAGA